MVTFDGENGHDIEYFLFHIKNVEKQEGYSEA